MKTTSKADGDVARQTYLGAAGVWIRADESAVTVYVLGTDFAADAKAHRLAAKILDAMASTPTPMFAECAIARGRLYVRRPRATWPVAAPHISGALSVQGPSRAVVVECCEGTVDGLPVVEWAEAFVRKAVES